MLATRIVALGAVLAIAASSIALAQTAPGQHPMQMDPHSAMHLGTVPTMPGQDAFGTVQEIVQILDADPKTDWSKVNLEALRQHLIDMNEVTLKAEAAPKQIDGGLEITITGNDRTLVAIQRMIPAWVQTMNGHQGWSTKAAPLPNGEVVTVTATDPKEVRHIRGLGFIGLLVSGSHHQPHHLAMAKGEFAHMH
jgi:TusA-related sulfurtransferase